MSLRLNHIQKNVRNIYVGFVEMGFKKNMMLAMNENATCRVFLQINFFHCLYYVCACCANEMSQYPTFKMPGFFIKCRHQKLGSV